MILLTKIKISFKNRLILAYKAFKLQNEYGKRIDDFKVISVLDAKECDNLETNGFMHSWVKEEYQLKACKNTNSLANCLSATHLEMIISIDQNDHLHLCPDCTAQLLTNAKRLRK